jgi:beta-lactam-binding protein with PASTA domain
VQTVPGPERVVYVPVAVPVRRQCVVPKLSGFTLRRARTALTKARCQLGKVTRRRSRTRRGRVIRSSQRAGRRLGAGTRIALVVSRGRR